MTDPCADIPDAPAPKPYKPVPGERWRQGRKVSRNLYRCTPDSPYGEYVGVVDTPELAALVVHAVNQVLIATDPSFEYVEKELPRNG